VSGMVSPVAVRDKGTSVAEGRASGWLRRSGNVPGKPIASRSNNRHNDLGMEYGTARRVLE